MLSLSRSDQLPTMVRLIRSYTLCGLKRRKDQLPTMVRLIPH